MCCIQSTRASLPRGRFALATSISGSPMACSLDLSNAYRVPLPLIYDGVNVPVRILEPRGAVGRSHVHVALELHVGHLVVLERHALFFQRANFSVDIIDGPRNR